MAGDLILASGSPRRRELLERLGIPFSVITADIDETAPEDAAPEEVVLDISARKAQAVFCARPDCTVLAADTIVYHKGRILGKPKDFSDAVGMLRELSGDVHEVYTGGWILSGTQSDYFCERTRVEFFSLTEEEIFDYVSSMEPFDKAGGYGIQGLGALLVRGIEGDFYTVMGLPIGRVGRILKKMYQNSDSR